jgi:hypothetical protein
LPPSAGRPDAIRFRAYTLPKASPSAVEPGAVRLLRVNQVFTVGDTYQPTPTLFSWTGNVPLALDGDWYELRF